MTRIEKVKAERFEEMERWHKDENYLGKRERGAVLFHMTLGTAMLKWQCQRAVKVFSVNLVILKNKIMYF